MPTTPLPDWSEAPARATHWSPLNQKFYTRLASHTYCQANYPHDKPVHAPDVWINHLIPRPVELRPQQFGQYRLACEQDMLAVEGGFSRIIPEGSVVTFGGFVQFDPHWVQVAVVHHIDDNAVAYVTTVLEEHLLPLETPEEQAAREQIEALYQVLASNPGSYAEQAHQLYDAGCRMPLDKTKE